MVQVHRRQFLIAAGSLLAAPPLLAQRPGRNYRIGVFFSGREPVMRRYLDELRTRLARHGFDEGRNLQVDLARATYNPDADRQTVRKLLDSSPDALFTFTTFHTLTAQSLKSPVPIVFTFVGDAVAYGLVKEVHRPGGNTTGASTQQREIKRKRLEFLRELLPHAKNVGVVGYFGETDLLFNVNEAALRMAAGTLGFTLLTEPGWRQNAGGFIPAMRKAADLGAEAFYIFHPLAVSGFIFGGEDVIKFAHERRIPAIFEDSEPVELGGLMSYGTSLVDEVRRSADQLARVLKGANPAELPVDLAARFELVVNLKTAKALDITIPRAILLRADRVVE
jgi:putative tryptophan/tyrosine transport system substrate-binding protein